MASYSFEVAPVEDCYVTVFSPGRPHTCLLPHELTEGAFVRCNICLALWKSTDDGYEVVFGIWSPTDQSDMAMRKEDEE